MEQKNEIKGVLVLGKVSKVAKPKMYIYGPKFFMEVDSKQHGTVKVMVSIESLDNPTRQSPFKGDTVEFTGKEIKNGWINVTPKYHYAIIDDAGKQVINREICNNKVKILKTHINDLREQNYITEKLYQKFYNLFIEVEGHGGVFDTTNIVHIPSTSSPPITIKNPKLDVKSHPESYVKPHFSTKKDFSLPCPRCGGTGKINGKICRFCKGKAGTSL